MKNKTDCREQLSEIQDIIAETRSGYTGGGIIALVWALLSAAAIVIHLWGNVHNAWAIWVTHNVLGWIFTLLWFRRETQSEGRVYLRGRYTLRLWVVITLAMWMVVGMLVSTGMDTTLELIALLLLLIGMGIFSTGLISESVFSQCVGVVLLVAGPAIAIFAPRSIAPALSFGTVVLILLIWGLGSWLVKERR